MQYCQGSKRRSWGDKKPRIYIVSTHNYSKPKYPSNPRPINPIHPTQCICPIQLYLRIVYSKNHVFECHWDPIHEPKRQDSSNLIFYSKYFFQLYHNLNKFSLDKLMTRSSSTPQQSQYIIFQNIPTSNI